MKKRNIYIDVSKHYVTKMVDCYLTGDLKELEMKKLKKLVKDALKKDREESGIVDEDDNIRFIISPVANIGDNDD